MNDPGGPCYLSNANNASSSLVLKILTGVDNYSSWRRSMMVALLARNKVKFINGKLLALDEDDEDYDAWIKCNSLEYRPQPVCTCSAMKIIQEYQDEDKVLEFLIGLNESYLNARVHGYPPDHRLYGRFPREIPKPGNQLEQSSTNFAVWNDTNEGMIEEENLAA
uniref:Retrotransposon Copia-like N-terminal domain-containing protein n=1 Tax=Cannabis sativa TaxID=3483 RepID=A0A803NHF3_CANSA